MALVWHKGSARPRSSEDLALWIISPRLQRGFAPTPWRLLGSLGQDQDGRLNLFDLGDQPVNVHCCSHKNGNGSRTHGNLLQVEAELPGCSWGQRALIACVAAEGLVGQPVVGHELRQTCGFVHVREGPEPCERPLWRTRRPPTRATMTKLGRLLASTTTSNPEAVRRSSGTCRSTFQSFWPA